MSSLSHILTDQSALTVNSARKPFARLILINIQPFIGYDLFPALFIQPVISYDLFPALFIQTVIGYDLFPVLFFCSR